MIVKREPITLVRVYFGQTFGLVPPRAVVLEEPSAVPLPRANRCKLMCVSVHSPPSPGHGRTGRVRSHERTIHEDRGGLPARLLCHRQRKVSDGRHSSTSLPACLHTSVCCSQTHTLFSSHLTSLLF